MSVLEAIILGIVQGLTEFLPVSSSGHLELGKALLNINDGGVLFSVVLHGATALSTVVVFWKEIAALTKGVFKFKWNEEFRYVLLIIFSMIPVGIIGVFFEEDVEAFFTGKVRFVGAMLLATAALLFLTEKVKIQAGSRVSFRNAMIIGLAQAVAILPGISRSGATISTALLLRIDRTNSARFSFLMVIPPILGANLMSVMKITKGEAVVENISTVALAAGFISAFVIGFLACKWMISIVKNSKLYWFAIYCVIIGLIAIFIG